MLRDDLKIDFMKIAFLAVIIVFTILGNASVVLSILVRR
jgi:hypothetical protein